MAIYWRSFILEFLGNFVLGLALFTLFFFFGESSRILELALLAAGGKPLAFLFSFAYLFGQFWVSMSGFIMPMGMLLALTLVLARMHEDREIIALEAVGVNFAAAMRLFLLFTGLGFAALQYPLVAEVAPEARFALKHFAYRRQDPAQTFKVEPATWLDLGSAQIYAARVSGQRLYEVVLYVRPQAEPAAPGAKKPLPYKVTSKEAAYELIADAHGRPLVKLILYVGKLEFINREAFGDAALCYFNEYAAFLALPEAASFIRNVKEYPWNQIKQASKNDSSPEVKTEYLWRLNLIFAPLVLALAGGLTALRFGRRSKGFGFGLGLALIACYWLMTVLFLSLNQPLLTNVAYFIFGLLLLYV